MIFGAAKFQVDVKGGGGSDLNVQLTLSGGKVKMSTAPYLVSTLEVKKFFTNLTIFVYKPQNKQQLFKICIVSNFIAKNREKLCFLDLLKNRFSYVFPNQTDNLILYCLTRVSGICMASFTMIF